ncbi:hypothetical protein [Streptomyces sp. NRRL F-2664]|uniref:hypothetical protein n=1 Tax=Streptomyces sp. NRRL F-2664 TaxID=1463842 RepID=UPI0006920968|nr:hypothetical protein [Streptomyces sp. NRRL F-2664]
MDGIQDYRQHPGHDNGEQKRTFHPGQDPVHPEPAPHGTDPERERRREEDLRDWDQHDETF